MREVEGWLSRKVPVLISRTCAVTPCGKRDFADVTRSGFGGQESIACYLGGPSVITRALVKGVRGVQVKVGVTMEAEVRKTGRCEDGGRDHKPKNSRGISSWKGQEKGCSSRASRSTA